MATAAEPGEWQVVGQLTEASNATLLVERNDARFVYKPVRGERPLWDFPDGTLGRREVAAYEVSRLLGWDVVPLTRWVDDAPYGPGSMQQWVSADAVPVGVFEADAVPEGWLPVISAVDDDDRPLEVAHRDTPQLRAMAVFDLLTNNADRKGSHIYQIADGSIRGIDQGLCFHTEHKLRTVLWGFIGQAIPEQLLTDLERVLPDLTAALVGLTSAESIALHLRAERLLTERTFPAPQGWSGDPMAAHLTVRR